jgi:DNA-binding SARP family transcriptional activator
LVAIATNEDRPAGRLVGEAFDRFPYGILVFDSDRRLDTWNAMAARLIPGVSAGKGCCDLLGCSATMPMAEHCFTDLVNARGQALPEVRVDLPARRPDRALWITAAPLEEEGGMVVEVRPGDQRDRRRRTVPHWVAPPELRIRTFGRTRVDGREGPIAGSWLDQRPGQILKLLICDRGRVVHSDAIAEAIWPDAGPRALSSVRHFVHVLRHSLEPQLGKRAPSSFVVSRRGGYMLSPETVRIDTEEFERRVLDGLAAFGYGREEAARIDLHAAVAMYEGDFLADEPYAQWVLSERERLRRLACESLRALATISIRGRDMDAAAAHTERLSELMPYDLDVHRRLIAMLIASARHSEAARCYDLLRGRMTVIFDEEPDFQLTDVSAAEAYRE